MILASLTRALRTQNWLAVFLEFVIVIAGVVIGLQINAWNEERTSSAQEQSYLDALSNELRHSLETADRYLAFTDSSLSSVMALLLASNPGAPPLSAEEFDGHMLDGMFRYREFKANTETLDELQDTGLQSAIRDPATRDALSRVSYLLESLKQTEADYLHVMTAFSDPWLMEHYDLRRIHPADPTVQNATELAGVQPLLDTDPRVLLQDLEFQNILALRSITQTNTRNAALR